MTFRCDACYILVIPPPEQLTTASSSKWMVHGKVAMPFLMNLTFSVATGLAGFTKTVGLEMAQKGNITCNAICPGYVLTDLIRNQLEDTAKARGISKVCSWALTLFCLRCKELVHTEKVLLCLQLKLLSCSGYN